MSRWNTILSTYKHSVYQQWSFRWYSMEHSIRCGLKPPSFSWLKVKHKERKAALSKSCSNTTLYLHGSLTTGTSRHPNGKTAPVHPDVWIYSKNKPTPKYTYLLHPTTVLLSFCLSMFYSKIAEFLWAWWLGLWTEDFGGRVGDSGIQFYHYDDV